MNTINTAQTYHASQATHLSDLINLKFAAQRFGTVTPRFVRVREPDGPSTDGGRHARQPIVLLKDMNEVGGIVCGFIDITKHHAELRSFAVVAQAHSARFNKEIDITRGEYNRFLDAMQQFLETQTFETHITNAPRRPSTIGPAIPQIAPAEKEETRPVLWLIVGFCVGFGICYGLVSMGIIR